MAQVQYGTIITEIKGKIGGQVFQRGNKAFVLRNKNSKQGRLTNKKSLALISLSQIASSWRNITTADRLAWTTAAASWAFTDKFGGTYYGSGYQCYVAYNRSGRVIDNASVATPNLPASPAYCAVTNVTFTGPSAINVFTSNLTPTGQFLCVYASRVMSKGVTRTNVPMKFLGYVPLNALMLFAYGSQYIAAYGSIKTGGVIAFRFQQRLNAYPYAYYTQEWLLYT